MRGMHVSGKYFAIICKVYVVVGYILVNMYKNVGPICLCHNGCVNHIFNVEAIFVQ